MEEIRYELKKSFGYAYKGEQRDASFITLSAPTVENIGFAAKLKQGFMKAVKGQGSSAAESDSDKDKDGESIDDLSGEMIMAMLSMSDVDYAAYMQTASAVFSSPGIALIDGEEPLKKALMLKMLADDLETMTGEYLKAFILTSVSEIMQA